MAFPQVNRIGVFYVRNVEAQGSSPFTSPPGYPWWSLCEV